MIELIKRIAADDPIREVDWQWQAAKEVVAARKHISAGLQKDVIARATHYLRAKQNKRKAEDKVIHAAWKIHQDPSDPKRLETEMRALAGQSLEDVGRAVGHSPEIMEIYCLLFFDVRERLDAKDYIYCRLLSPCRPESSRVERLRNFVHRMGYLGGPIVADGVMDHFAAIRAAIYGEYDFRNSPMSEEKRVAALAVAMTAPLTNKEITKLTAERVENELVQNPHSEMFFASELEVQLQELFANDVLESDAGAALNASSSELTKDGEVA